jgi:uncharacterized membrane protein
MSHDSSLVRSPLIKTILFICLSLLSLFIMVVTTGMIALCSFFIANPELYPGDISDRAATYLGFMAVGGCLLKWIFVWLLVRYRWMARSTGKWFIYCSWAIASLNGVLLLIPLVAWKSAF